MSTFNPNAPAFIPSFLRQSKGVSGTDASVPAAHTPVGAVTPSPENPIVILLFGNRGAGKSTQSARIAKEYNLMNISSGTIYMEGKQPFVELRKILQEEFGNGKERRYNGIVLDRFIAISEYDAFYVQSALDSVHLPVPFVFMLSMDPELASRRAEARGDNKTGLQFWRAVEQKAQGVTANTIYAPIESLKVIQCTENSTVDDVFEQIRRTVETKYSNAHHKVRLPNAARHEHAGMRLIEDYETYMQLANDVHASVGNKDGRKDSAPLSSIGAYLDKDYFSFSHKNLRSLLSTFRVTLKADGQRFLLVKHKKYGYIGFPSAFTHGYDLNTLFDGVCLSFDGVSDEAKKFITAKEGADSPIELLLDTEMVIHDGLDNPKFYVLDYIYMWGLEGKRSRFEHRLKVLRDYFKKMTQDTNVSSVVVLKDYVPINKIKTLLPKWDINMHLPIDGLVFQHNEVYRFGRDKFLVKWKPVELCTVDFRLANGVEKGEEWIFDLMVSDDTSKDSKFGEVPYPHALTSIPEEIVKGHHLCNGMIVELFLQHRNETDTTPNVETRWKFKGVRNDKPTPNKYSIVKKIIDLKHLSYDELVDLCEKVHFFGAEK